MNCCRTTSKASSHGFKIALFGPQVTNWTNRGLLMLQSAILEDRRLGFLKQTLTELPSLWPLLEEDYGLHGFSASEKLHELREFAGGTKDLDPQDLTNTQLSSLTVVSQVINLIQLTDASDITDTSNMRDGVLGFEGTQGFCIGFLSAAALASANDWTEVEHNVSAAVRLAACIGIVVDARWSSRLAQERATAVHVRWKTAEDRTFLEICLDSFPGAYISCITDDRTVTVTLPSDNQSAFCSQMREAKIAITTIGLNGYYHDSRNAEAAERLVQICTRSRGLTLPDAAKLRLPLRSTADGRIIIAGALHEIAIQVILCKRAHWYQTVKSTVEDFPHAKVIYVPLGGESSIPRSLSVTDDHGRVSPAHHCETSLEEIAVVGMACRFPRAENLEQFRELLWTGETAIGKIPSERFKPAELSREPKLANFWGNFLDSPDTFDHRFFGISGREAKSMDPQQRLALQIAYEALESSGYCSAASTSIGSDVGCYLGVGSVDYEDNIASHDANAFAATGTLRAFISGRISHFFKWSGPSITFDTACSSSAVAIHTACKALLGDECSMALAGGVNIITSPSLHQNLSAASFLNTSGSSRAFDAGANGYCRGEGAGILVLKTLSRAIADGDAVLGVIAASAVNQGVNHSNITVPDSQSQSSLYERVLSTARIEAKEITYVEAHGTGTPVGDPVEYESIRLALTGPWRDDEVFLGSVKDNIGHTEAASGVAGVIKTLLMMQYKTIPKQANFVSLNPRIKASTLGQIVVPRATQPWTAQRHVALVNNYGAAGSNAALILRAHSSPLSSPTKERIPGTCDIPSHSPDVSPILLSARTASSLQSYMDMLKLYLPKAETSLASVAYKIARSHNLAFEHRISFTAPDVKSAISILNCSSAATKGIVVRTAKHPVILCFGGQTSSNVSVSMDLYERCDLFRTYLGECNAICQTLGLPSIFPAIFQEDTNDDIISLHCTLLSLQISCAKCWIDCGLKVDIVIGHSFGQLAALCVAESISITDAFLFVSGRARLIRDIWGPKRGAMLSVEGEREEVEAVVRLVNLASDLHVDVACYNGPRSFVLAGDEPSLERAEKECRALKKTRLRNSHAYHSHLADDILYHLATVAKSIKIEPPRIRIETCSAGGTWSHFTAEHMVQHTRQPVYFVDAVERIASRSLSAVWLEAGSASPIIAMARRITALKPNRSDIFIPTDLGGADATTNLANAACQLWRAGSDAQHWLFHSSSRHRYQMLNLPPYQFDKTSHWIQYKPRSRPETKEALNLVTLLSNDNCATGDYVFSVNTSSTVFELAARGHAVTGQSLCPASMYVELAASCIIAMQRTSLAHVTGLLPHIEGLVMSAPLTGGTGISVFLRLNTSGPERWKFTVFSRPSSSNEPAQNENREIEHVKGRISSLAASQAIVERQLKLLQRSCTHRIRNLSTATGVNGSMVYKLFSDVVEYAGYYRGVQSVSVSGNEAVGLITVPKDQPSCMSASICDLISLDNFLQVAGIHVNCLSQRNDDQVFMCIAVEEIIFSSSYMTSKGNDRSWTVYTGYEPTSKADVTNDIFVCDSNSGNLALAIMGANFRAIPFKSVARSLARLNRAPTTTTVTTSSHSSNDGHLHDSTFRENGGPSLSRDGFQNELSSHTSQSPERQSTVGVSSSQTVLVHQQQVQQPNQPSNLTQPVRNMFSAILEIPVEEIEAATSLDDLGIDSLLVTEVLAEIQSRFHVCVSPAQLMNCTDVLSVTRLIQPMQPTEKHQDLINGLAQEQEWETRVKLTNGYLPSPVRKESQDMYDHHESGQAHEETMNLAALSYDCFIDAKDSYDHHAETTSFTGFCSKVFPLQSKLVVQYVIKALNSLGCTLSALKSGDEVPIFQFEPRHKKLVPQLYKILEDAGLVTNSADGVFYRTEEPVPAVSTSALHEEMLNRFPQHASETKLLHTTAPKLADCLSWLTDPLALLFRDSTARTLLEDVYTNAPMFKTGTLLLAQYLGMVLRRVGANRELKILELGAGTGGTSKHIIESLAGLKPKSEFSYTFTDLSTSLVAAARRKFAKWPFMHYTVLDIEKDRSPEFVGAYDIILSVNCVHATKSLVQSCTNIRKMLRTDGVLCLIELTQNLYWFDLVFGLLDGWWLFEDGRQHALVDKRRWEESLRASGFEWVDWSQSPSAESDILRVITASPYKIAPDGTDSGLIAGDNIMANGRGCHAILKETMTFKEMDGLHLQADIYYPLEAVEPGERLPVALMIHGGGHIMLSKNDIRPEQTSKLLKSGFLPVSIDYRLCPETTLLDGPMADVADALLWIRTVLPTLILSRGDVRIDTDKVVAVGWSTGGHLAMTLAWTAAARQIRPPEAILAFYCPTDYEDSFWLTPNMPAGVQTTETDPTTSDSYDLDDSILEGLFNTPITEYNIPSPNRALGGWLAPSDARSRLALYMNIHARTLHVLLGGALALNQMARKIPLEPPLPEHIAAISPLAQIRTGNYATPTFLVHPRDDDLIPWQQAERTWQALRDTGNADAELRIVEGVPHLFDMDPRYGDDEAAVAAVREGYEFLCRFVGLTWRG